MFLSYSGQPAHPCSLISAFVVRCLDSNKLFYSSKLYSSIGKYTVSPTCQFAESVLSLHVHLFKLRCYTDSVSLCTGMDVEYL